MRNVLLAVLVVGIYSHVDAAVLCTPKSGQGNVAVRTECKKNEVQLDPATVGLQVKGPAVYDANDVQVGEFFSSDNPLVYVNIVLRVGPYTLPLNVDHTHIWPTNILSNSLRFESTDCSGTPYLPAPGTDNFLSPLIAVSDPGNTLYVGDAGASPQTIQPKSELLVVSETALPPFSCTPVTSGPLSAIPLTPLISLDTLFTPPFNIR